MTSRGYFGKMNSTLGSVVPLAMFSLLRHVLICISVYKTIQHGYKFSVEILYLIKGRSVGQAMKTEPHLNGEI